MTLATKRRAGGLPLLLAAALMGCTPSEPVQFYMLSSSDTESVVDIEAPLRLGVGPIELPAYLDRPQVVTRLGENLMNVAEFDQWAEPLEATFQRVLIDNLSRRLTTDFIVELPLRRDTELDHQLEVEVTRFDADETGQVVLDARWRILDGAGRRLAERGHSVVREAAAEPGNYEQIAATMSRALAIMSDDIAGALAML